MNWINENNLLDAKKKSNIKIDSQSNEKLNLDNGCKNKQTANEDCINEPKANKKLRCGVCKFKISSVDEIIATCKCNKSHCLKHRMPEAHNCEKIEDIGKEQRKNLEQKLVKLGENKTLVKI
jgi:hypothetical protein